MKKAVATFIVVFALCFWGVAQEPLDLFGDAPSLDDDFVRIACWNLQHFDLRNGADDFLPGTNDAEDMAILVATYAKAIGDLGLDLIALVEHQRIGNEPDRLAMLVAALNGGGTGPWQSIETNIEYDDPSNRFMNLQMCAVWNSDKVTIDPNADRLLEDLRQPRNPNGTLADKGKRVPWLVEAKAGSLEFDLIVLHLKSGGSFPQADEVAALEGFIRARQTGASPRHLIVLGDWNLRPDNSTQRNRIRKMMVPTNGVNLMRVLTVEVIKPTLEGWEELGSFKSDNAVADLVPFSHFNHRPATRTIDTLLDHIAISRTLDEVFDHPIEVTLEDGSKDVRPGIRIAKPVLDELDFLNLTDHLPVILTLRTTNAATPGPGGGGSLQIVAAIPNPVTDDRQDEEVRLRNVGSASISLAGWKIQDAGSRNWDLTASDGSVAPGATVTVVRQGRSMGLNNSGPEVIRIIDPSGTTIHEVSYNGASSGQVVTFP